MCEPSLTRGGANERLGNAYPQTTSTLDMDAPEGSRPRAQLARHLSFLRL